MNRFYPRLAVLIAAVAIVAGCSGQGADTGSEASEQPAENPSTEQPTEPNDDLAIDWNEPFALSLANGWTVARCDGDAPMVCISDGDRYVGTVELIDYALPDDFDGNVDAYLQTRAADFFDGNRADRAEGCSHLTFEPLDATAHVIGGVDGIRLGFRMLDASGHEVERHVLYFVVDQDAHFTITASAYGEQGCAERLGEFEPADLVTFEPFLDRIVTATALPAPTHHGWPAIALADGDYEMRIMSIDAPVRVIDVHLVEMLSGDEALAAARAAGEIGPGEDLPNDFYIREHPDEVFSITLDEATVEIVDCTQQCQRVEVDTLDFVSGHVRPLNGPLAIFAVTVRDAKVVTFSEIYLP